MRSCRLLPHFQINPALQLPVAACWLFPVMLLRSCSVLSFVASVIPRGCQLYLCITRCPAIPFAPYYLRSVISIRTSCLEGMALFSLELRLVPAARATSKQSIIPWHCMSPFPPYCSLPIQLSFAFVPGLTCLHCLSSCSCCALD